MTAAPTTTEPATTTTRLTTTPAATTTFDPTLPATTTAAPTTTEPATTTTQTTTTTVLYFYVVNGDSNSEADNNKACAAAEEVHGVRCCNAALPIPDCKSRCYQTGSQNIGYKMSFADGQAECEKDTGYSFCTESQLIATVDGGVANPEYIGCANFNTADPCGYDNMHVWTSQPCTPDQGGR